MEQEVYVDILFMIDLSMDFLCIFISAKILHKKLSLARALLAATLGAIYSVSILFADISPPISVLLDISMCAVISTIALSEKRQGFKQHLFNVLVYFTVCAVMGGMMSGIFNLLSKYANNGQANGIQEDDIGPVIFLILAVVSSIAVGITGRFFKRNVSKRRCSVVVTFCGYRAEFNGINDSGNLLKDALSGKCVIPISKKIASSIFSQGMADIFDGPADLSSLENLQPYYAAKIRLIPSTTAMGKGILIALIPDKVEIKTDKGDTYTADALVAPIDIDSDDIEALVPDELMN